MKLVCYLYQQRTCRGILEDEQIEILGTSPLEEIVPIGRRISSREVKLLAPVNPLDLSIGLRLNGKVMQKANTSDMVFSRKELVNYLSQCMTLLPGTVILTGTPSGVGFARKPPVFLRPGDLVEVEIGGIGSLENKVAPSSQKGMNST